MHNSLWLMPTEVRWVQNYVDADTMELLFDL